MLGVLLYQQERAITYWNRLCTGYDFKNKVHCSHGCERCTNSIRARQFVSSYNNVHDYESGKWSLHQKIYVNLYLLYRASDLRHNLRLRKCGRKSYAIVGNGTNTNNFIILNFV